MNVSAGWGVLGAILRLVFLYSYVGGMPALSGHIVNVDASMRDLVAGKGHWISVMAFNANTMGLIYTGTYLVLFGLIFSLYFCLCWIYWFLLCGGQGYILYYHYWLPVSSMGESIAQDLSGFSALLSFASSF